MPTVDERLRQVTLKVKRAKEHISDLESEIRAFLDGAPYKVGAKHHPETRRLVYYVTSVDPIPDCIPLVAGDAIQNLVSALDHLAYQIVCSDSMDAPPKPYGIYFPIAENAEQYEERKSAKMQGAQQETFDAIDALNPYKGGNDLLWILSKLNNIEKHRLLLTVGSQAAGVHLGQIMADQATHFTADARAALERMDIFINPADKGFPLKAGFELLMMGVNEKPNPEQQFLFTVATNEPGIVEGKPILETLQELSNVVEQVVAALRPRLQ